MNKEYKFTETWFSDVAEPVWKELFKQVPMPKTILEIGCYEGRATTWLCDNVLSGDGIQYDVVDTFGGSLEEAGMVNAKEGLRSSGFIEENFKHNISFHPSINFTLHKGSSQLILPTLPMTERYDLVYVDASHRSDDTFVDSYYAAKMLKVGGLIIFDDYAWKDPKNMHVVNSPELAISVFYNMYDNKFRVIHQGYQVMMIKTDSI
jgi:predicted O-methyltransferase YrrM